MSDIYCEIISMFEGRCFSIENVINIVPRLSIRASYSLHFDVFIHIIGNSKLWYHVGTVVGMEPFIDWYRSLSAVHFE